MNRMLFIAGLVYVLLVVGLAAKIGPLLALSIPLVVYAATALLQGPAKPEVRLSREISADRVSEGMPVTVKVSITNLGSRLESVLAHDDLPQGVEVLEGESRAFVCLDAGETLDLEYTVSARRGRYVFSEVQLTASETLGLFQRRLALNASQQLSVIPSSLRTRRLAIRPLRTRATAGPVPARHGGTGIDFFGVREYQVGDPRRWINWRTSARHPRNLFTNEFQQERIADVGLILDARRHTDVRLETGSLFEHAARATASLAEAFLSDGNRVGLLVYGHFLDWTFPGYGKVQRERILRALARAKTGDSQVFENLEYLPTRYFPAQSQLIVVSPLCAHDISMLVRLRARGYQVLVVRPDPVAYETRVMPPQKAVELASRFIRVERALILRRLQQSGIQVVDWQVDRPFDQVLHASLGRMPHWFRAVGVEP